MKVRDRKRSMLVNLIALSSSERVLVSPGYGPQHQQLRRIRFDPRYVIVILVVAALRGKRAELHFAWHRP